MVVLYCVAFVCAVLCCVVFSWVGLGWVRLGWVGLGCGASQCEPVRARMWVVGKGGRLRAAGLRAIVIAETAASRVKLVREGSKR